MFQTLGFLNRIAILLCGLRRCLVAITTLAVDATIKRPDLPAMTTVAWP